MKNAFTLGILETGRPPEPLEETHGSFPQMFADLLCENAPEWEFRAYRVMDGEFPFSIDECDAWLITGSKASVYDGDEWIDDLKEFLEDAYEEHIPLVGICFGHQVLAEALGGTVEKSRKGWGLGVQAYTVTDAGRGILPDLESFAVNSFHQDQVLELPEDAKVLAESSFCPYAALDYNGRALSFQGHPEFDRAFTKDLLQSRRGTLLDPDQTDEAVATLEQSTDSSKLAKTIVEFVEKASEGNTPTDEPDHVSPSQ